MSEAEFIFEYERDVGFKLQQFTKTSEGAIVYNETKYREGEEYMSIRGDELVDSYSSLAMACQSSYALEFLMNLLEPERHRRLLNGVLRNLPKAKSAGRRLSGVHVKQKTDKKFWYDPSELLVWNYIHRVSYGTVRKESQLLERFISDLPDTALEKAAELADEIDFLQNPLYSHPMRVYINIVSQSGKIELSDRELPD